MIKYHINYFKNFVFERLNDKDYYRIDIRKTDDIQKARFVITRKKDIYYDIDEANYINKFNFLN